MRITLALLQRLNACEGQQQLFRETYPDGVELTAANLRDAACRDLCVGWLIYRLPSDRRKLFWSKWNGAPDNKIRNDGFEACLLEAYEGVTEDQLLPSPTGVLL